MQNKDTNKLLLIYILLIAIFCLLVSCSKDGFLSSKKNIELSIDSKLPKDQNGYSIYTLYNKDVQNIHTISGSIRVNGIIPDNPREKVEWESSHYWRLKFGDTIGTIYRRTWRGLGWQIVDSIKVTNFKPSEVPTINPVCYNSADGSINTVIAPMWFMRGDTMTIVAKTGGVSKVEKIILR
jgi:hypothetical protein